MLHLPARKEILRKKFLSYRKKLSVAELQQKSFLAQENVLKYLLQVDFNTIALYAPIQNEVETSHLFEILKRKDKKIFYPVTVSSQRKLKFIEVNDPLKFKKGAYGIPEPFEQNRKQMPLHQIQVFVIPGLAFDGGGHRLGYGKGYYDHSLKNSKGLRIGLLYDFQLINEKIAETHDLVMNVLVSDERILVMRTQVATKD